jgi:hypothetical protein
VKMKRKCFYGLQPANAGMTTYPSELMVNINYTPLLSWDGIVF